MTSILMSCFVILILMYAAYLLSNLFKALLHWNVPADSEEAMTDTGKHRRKSDLRPGIPDQFRELTGHENVDPWKISHHFFEPIEFDCAEDVFEFLLSKNGATDKTEAYRRRDWRIWAPKSIQTMSADVKANMSELEFKEYFLDHVLEQIRQS